MFNLFINECPRNGCNFGDFFRVFNFNQKRTKNGKSLIQLSQYLIAIDLNDIMSVLNSI